MGDSRRASKLEMKDMRIRVESQTRVIQFLGTILASLLLVFLLGDPSFEPPQTYVLFLLFFSIGLWITEAIPPFAVGILIVGFLVFFLGQPAMAEYGIAVEKYVNTWSDSVIWLLLGGFFLAAGMKKTKLDFQVFKFAFARFSNNERVLLLAMMMTTGMTSMFMSNTATTAMMLASLMPLINHLGKTSNLSKALLIGIPASASIGGMGTIIGSPPNAIAVDMINKLTITSKNIGFLEWMMLGLPVSLILIAITWRFILNLYPPEPTPDLKDIIPEEEQAFEPANIQEKQQRKWMIYILITTVLLWLTDGLHPIPMAAVSGIPIIGLTMLNIVTAIDVRSIPWDTLMLVAGGLSLGLAIQETGLLYHFIEKIQHFSLSTILLVIVFAVLTVVSSNFMSNTAAAAILIPAAILWDGINPMLLPLIIGMFASCALFLPVSTPPNAIAYSTGLVDQKWFRPSGIFVGLIGPILVIIWVSLLVNTWYN